MKEVTERRTRRIRGCSSRRAAIRRGHRRHRRNRSVFLVRGYRIVNWRNRCHVILEEYAFHELAIVKCVIFERVVQFRDLAQVERGPFDLCVYWGGQNIQVMKYRKLLPCHLHHRTRGKSYPIAHEIAADSQNSTIPSGFHRRLRVEIGDA